MAEGTIGAHFPEIENTVGVEEQVGLGREEPKFHLGPVKLEIVCQPSSRGRAHMGINSQGDSEAREGNAPPRMAKLEPTPEGPSAVLSGAFLAEYCVLQLVSGLVFLLQCLASAWYFHNRFKNLGACFLPEGLALDVCVYQEV